MVEVEKINKLEIWKKILSNNLKQTLTFKTNFYKSITGYSSNYYLSRAKALINNAEIDQPLFTCPNSTRASQR